MNTSYISKLKLFNFRNYKSIEFGFQNGINVIFGKNGIGKTNILEALSFLSQGRGLRSGNLDEVLLKSNYINAINKNNLNYNFDNILWSIFTEIKNSSKFENISIYTSFTEDKTIRKNIKINGNSCKQESLNNVFNIIWLTPRMNKFFNDASSTRRRFIDKAVCIIDPMHLKRVNKYDFFVRERMKLLTNETPYDPQWISVLERKIAENGVAIAVARNEIIEYLNQVFERYYMYFPSVKINANGYFETLVKKNKSLDCEKKYIEQLKDNRVEDLRTKKTNIGVHRSDISFLYKNKGMHANLCSTGEQKSMLISLTLAKAIVCNMLHKAKPILLLDEICSHLDDAKKANLFDELKKLNVQSFLTGISKDLFHFETNFLDLEKECS